MNKSTKYRQLFNQNKENFTFEVNRLIIAFNFDFNRTFVNIYTYEYNRIVYYFFVFEEVPITNTESKTQISDLYPSGFIFGDYSECIDYYKIHGNINNVNAKKLAEFNGYEFNIIVQDQDYLDFLKKQLNERIIKKYITTYHGVPTSTELTQLHKIEIEIPTIELLISDEYLNITYVTL